MKTTRLLAAILLTLLFTSMNAASTFAHMKTIDGHLDSIRGNAIAGWILDTRYPDESITATVTITDALTGEIAAQQTADADEYRDDLTSVGIGTGAHGFHVYIDWEELPEAIYTVSLSANGTTIPQTLSHTHGNAVTSHAALIPLGTFKTTGYCPCYQCSEGWGRQTSSGNLATADHTVAVDKRVIPMGSRLLINGQVYVAQDIGGGVKGKHIDIYFNTHAETRQHGVRNAEVFLIQ